ncbi:MerR family transcriptional regulator [Deinococcus roseus]|uniref:MerR family transcriptional regulator n=1 Tax=Deinococcus roseus TaxID=392414 RepID=A0ABQ2D367_9DEIO|nr:MerR family transcriptional regulator [Deinococcus roseus]GGJ43372.1 MerR family transcriptional regulator [Deinococcus roseus]
MTSPALTPIFLTMREAVEASGLSEDTLRYYEKLGLVMPERDRSSNHRRYSEQQMRWLKFLIHLRSTGMPLEKIQRYVQLALQGEESAPQRKAILEEHHQQIQEQIQKLQQSSAAIELKLQHYDDIERALRKGDVQEVVGRELD